MTAPDFAALDKLADPEDPWVLARLQFNAIVRSLLEDIGCCDDCLAKADAAFAKAER